MKNIVTTILLLISTNTLLSQEIVNITSFENTVNEDHHANKYYKDLDNNYSRFLGIWQSAVGNLTFKLTLSKVTMAPYTLSNNCFRDEIIGKFMMIENLGLPNETILYRSDKNFMNSDTPWIPAIRTIADIENVISGAIVDNCINPNPKYASVMGKFTFEVLNTNPNTAHLQVKKMSGLHSNEEPEFKIPTNIILTKM